jgi:hypothetical protein
MSRTFIYTLVKRIPQERVMAPRGGAGGRILLSVPQAALQRGLPERKGIRFHGNRAQLEGHKWLPGSRGNHAARRFATAWRQKEVQLEFAPNAEYAIHSNLP